MSKRTVIVLALCLASVIPSAMVVAPAGADPYDSDGSWASSDYDYASNTLNNFLDDHERNLVNPISKAVRAKSSSAATATGSKSGSSSKTKTKLLTKTTVAFREPLVPKSMAAAYPPADRDRMIQTFSKLLSGYGQIETQFAIPKRDVAGATAAFIIGSYMAYNGVGLPDEQFVPVVNQIRTVLASSPEFARMGVKDRQNTYEQMAILGMFMANAQLAMASNPNPEMQATMRNAAGAYLRSILQVEPDSVAITASGLVLR